MKPTYEQLEAELELTKSELELTKKELLKTQELLRMALDEIAKLKEQLNLNSKNSSKPPSSDQKGNTSGGGRLRNKKGRKGKSRSPFPPERIDRHIQCTQDNCPHCGSSAIKLNGQSPEIVQQAELPEAKAIVTEYQLLKYNCQDCGKNSVSHLPNGIADSAFGSKLMALLATLTGVFHLAKREAIQLIKELYDVDIALGSVSNIEERVAEALNPIYDRIHDFVMGGTQCKHFDETGWRNNGKRHFVWLASCEQAAYYRIDKERSSEAFRRLVKRNTRDFAAVTDRYAVYNLLGKIHQYCLAHLIREFRRYAERNGIDKEIGEALERELSIVCQIHGDYRERNITLCQRSQRIGHRKRKVRMWLEDGIANGSEQLYKLCENLLDDFEKLWTFTKVHGMEPTNNLAERDLRKLVVWRKKSYGTRSERGKKFVERITTVSQTLKRGGKAILGFIQEAVRCFYASTVPPCIFEAIKA